MSSFIYLCYILLSITTGQAAVSLSYEKTVTLAGGSNTFSCVVISATSVNIVWLFNGTDIALLNLSTVSHYDVYDNGNNIGVLSFNNINVLYNGTSIQCQAVIPDEVVQISNEFILLVQGLPPCVSNLRVSVSNYHVHVTWSAVPSLDIPDVDPDVTYCIHFSNTSTTTHSSCNITTLSYDYTLPDSVCNPHRVQVVAVNVLGTSGSVEQRIETTDLELQDVQLSCSTNSSNKMASLHMFQDVCYDVLTVISNGVLVSLPPQVHPNIVQLELPDNGIFDVIIYISNRPHTAINTSIRTFDVVSTFAEATSPSSNIVEINSTFIADSAALGVLYALMYIDHHGNIVPSQSIYFPTSRGVAMGGVQLEVSRGSYVLVSYDIEETGQLQESNTPARATILQVNGRHIDYKHHYGYCATNLSSSSLWLACYCPHLYHYQALLQRYDRRTGDVVNSMGVVKSVRVPCSERVEFLVETDVMYLVVVFVENKEYGVLGSHTFYAAHLTAIAHSEDDATSGNNTTIQPTSNTLWISLSFLLLLCVCVVFIILTLCGILRRRRKTLNNRPNTQVSHDLMIPEELSSGLTQRDTLPDGHLTVLYEEIGQGWRKSLERGNDKAEVNTTACLAYEVIGDKKSTQAKDSSEGSFNETLSKPSNKQSSADQFFHLGRKSVAPCQQHYEEVTLASNIL